MTVQELHANHSPSSTIESTTMLGDNNNVDGGRGNYVSEAAIDEGHDDGNGILVPSYDSCERTSSFMASYFNLLASMIGGGILSLPLAFEKCGLLLTTIMMIVAAILSDRSFILLCKISRETGATSFGEVGRYAFGKPAELFISALLFTVLVFIIVAYMVLLKDIWKPLLVDLIASVKQVPSTTISGGINEEILLIGILFLLTPFISQKTLHGLRYNSYVGVASASALCLALIFHSSVSWRLPEKDENHNYHDNNKHSNGNNDNDDVEDIFHLWEWNWNDVIFAFPIIFLSFMAQFNILPIQNELTRPSQKRMRLISKMAVSTTFVLYYLFGLFGYIYAGAQVDGNILKYVVATAPPSDWLFLLGRIGFGITIMFAVPVMILPCRASLLRLIDSVTMWEKNSTTMTNTETITSRHEKELEEQHQELLLFEQQEYGGVEFVTESTVLLSKGHSFAGDNRRYEYNYFYGECLHYGSTMAIIFICYTVSFSVPDVAILWSLCGSCQGFLISFILPAACYIKIYHHGHNHQQQAKHDKLIYNKKHNDHPQKSGAWILFSWILLIFASTAAIICTFKTIQWTFFPI